jgi:serine protease
MAKGEKHADLAGSGTAGDQIDVYRDGAKVATVANTGAYKDAVGGRGGGSHAYRVCEAGTEVCSNAVTVSF